MTKADFINAISTELERARMRGVPGTDISKAVIGKVLDASGTVALAMLGNGEDIPLANLGTLKVIQRAARAGRNPQTGEALQIPASRGVKLAAGKALKDSLK